MDTEGLRYILVTPAKNEEKYLPDLIRSISCQKVRPVAWFMIDDSSQDDTYRIMSAVASEYPWIYALRSGTCTGYDIEEHYSLVCIKAFDHAINYCRENDIRFEYVALSDADMLYPEDYFYNVINCLREDMRLGIVSGRVHILKESGEAYAESAGVSDLQYPVGTGRVWKRECFEGTGGYMLAKSPDAVSNAMAVLKGWDIKHLNYVCYQTRDTGGKISLWSGYYSRGRRAYYLGINPLGILNKVVDMVVISRQRKSMLKSAAFVSGYILSMANREKQIQNDEVKRYMGSYNRIVKSYLHFMKAVYGKMRQRPVFSVFFYH